MIKLAGRLETLAQQIKPSETMADIGTDHGFLPISLYQSGISPKVIMVDISEKALSRAREHGAGVEGLTSENYRVGDGLRALEAGEVDAVVLAGMGGILMKDILAADLPKTKSISKYVLQPRNHPEVLRRWLAQNNMTIMDEVLVRERSKLCEIIVVSSSADHSKDLGWTDLAWPEDDIRWEVPPMLAVTEDVLAKEYLHRKLQREQRVRREIQHGKSIDPIRLLELDGRITYLKELIRKREANDGI